mgnify:CR=1 FL=1
MVRNGRAINLRRRQLDKALGPSTLLSDVPVHKNGLIREIRQALAMTASQLGSRLGITQPAVTQLELSEQAGTISLNSLRKVADELDCRLIYALVPKRSLETVVEEQARKVALNLVTKVSHSMALEDESISPVERSQRVIELANKLVAGARSDIWDSKR